MFIPSASTGGGSQAAVGSAFGSVCTGAPDDPSIPGEADVLACNPEPTWHVEKLSSRS